MRKPHRGSSADSAFFDRDRFLQVLRDYIVFVTENDELKKMILRQHQTRAVEKVLRRAAEGHRTRGLVWHTQGSGKTLTMITIASLILRDTQGDKPTVLMLVDRNELEAQLFRNLESCGIRSPLVAQSKKHLRQILESDYRGLIVSMLHKFDNMPANINTRSNITVLIDEAHRTMGGPTLGVYLMAALPNATFIGFTGTPIDRISQGKGTFETFGCDDEKGYLDKYSIAESIEDGTTVGLHYAHAPSTLWVERELLEREFLQVAASEGVSDIEELNAILDRAVELKTMMKSPQRVDRVAQLVAQHFTDSVEPMGFKAFLVGVDREACALYKEALDRYLLPEYSAVVYSASPSDSELLKRHQIAPEDEKQVRRAFTRKGDLPKILIVTEKLLTGYDAPILYCMYLDKPMRDHVLLQTIARVNRPYEDGEGAVKPCGLVFDFVGIFERLQEALAFDSDVVTSVIRNIDVLKRLFERMMVEDARDYVAFARRQGDKGKEAQIEAFLNEEARKVFYGFFRRLQNVFDVLTPDPVLRSYLDDYQALSEMFGLLRNAYEHGPYVDRELTAKTRALLQKHTEGRDFELPGAIYDLGAEEIVALQTGDTSATTKVLNLAKVFGDLVEEKGREQPFLLPIGERAEALVKEWQDRRLSTEDALEAFLQLAQEYVDADAERSEMEVDANTFAIYTALKPAKADVSAGDAVELDALFHEHPDYDWNEAQGSRLRAALYKRLLTMVGKDNFIHVANTLLRLRRT